MVKALLTQAGDAGDEALLRLLIDRGAETTALPVDLAMRSGCADCAEMLLRHARDTALTRALESAARYGDSAGMRRLLDRGAEPTPAALRAAAASEGVPLAESQRSSNAAFATSRHSTSPCGTATLPWLRRCARQARMKPLRLRSH